MTRLPIVWRSHISHATPALCTVHIHSRRKAQGCIQFTRVFKIKKHFQVTCILSPNAVARSSAAAHINWVNVSSARSVSVYPGWSGKKSGLNKKTKTGQEILSYSLKGFILRWWMFTFLTVFPIKKQMFNRLKCISRLRLGLKNTLLHDLVHNNWVILLEMIHYTHSIHL